MGPYHQRDLVQEPTIIKDVGVLIQMLLNGVPQSISSAATGANQAAIGSLYTDTTNAKLYINGGSKAVPSWRIVTSA